MRARRPILGGVLLLAALAWAADDTPIARVVQALRTESSQGYNVLNAEETPFGAKKAIHTGTGTTIEFVSTVAGVAGAGSAVLEVLDGASQRCTLTFACNAASGTISTGACAAAFTAGAAITLQWDSTSGCTTLPLGNAAVSWE